MIFLTFSLVLLLVLVLLHFFIKVNLVTGGGKNKFLMSINLRIYSFLIFFSFIIFVCSFFQLIDMDLNILCLWLKRKSMLLARCFHFLFSQLGWCTAGGLIFSVIFLFFDTDNVGNMMVSSGGSGSSNSTWWPGMASFEERVLIEPFPETDTAVNQPEARPVLPANQVASPGAAQEALPQAPAPAEVAHPAPDPEENAALRREVHALIQEQVRAASERGWGRLSILFPEQRELNSEVAHNIMAQLELPQETNTGSLREWAERIRNDPNLLKPLIKDYLPKRR